MNPPPFDTFLHDASERASERGGPRVDLRGLALALGLGAAGGLACAPPGAEPSTPTSPRPAHDAAPDEGAPSKDSASSEPAGEDPADPSDPAPTESAESANADPSPNPGTTPSQPRLAVPADTLRTAAGTSAPVRAFVAAQRDAARPGTLWAGPLAGNGGRDVLIYVPPDVDPDAPVRLVFHFHGTYSEHLEREAPGVKKKKWVGWNRLEQTLAAADALAKTRDANVAVVYPLSAGRRIEPEWVGWANKQYDRMWMKAQGESFAALFADAARVLDDELGVPEGALRGGVVAEGHSAGGIALWHIAAGGPDGGADLVDEYLFLDAGFQDWADGCHDAIERHGLQARLTMVITDGGIADPWAGRTPWCREAPEHARRWPALRAECEPLLSTKPNTKPRGTDVSCRQLAADAEHWPRQQKWCAHMKNDMRDVPNVYVFRTKVAHGEQIAHFLGGLELPGEWWTRTTSDAHAP